MPTAAPGRLANECPGMLLCGNPRFDVYKDKVVVQRSAAPVVDETCRTLRHLRQMLQNAGCSALSRAAKKLRRIFNGMASAHQDGLRRRAPLAPDHPLIDGLESTTRERTQAGDHLRCGDKLQASPEWLCAKGSGG
jgi:hypothetical protein